MNRILKTFLLWLLVLALPVQGYAAATMGVCGSIHSHAGVPGATTAPHSHEGMPLSHQGHHHDSDEQVAGHQHEADSSHASAAKSNAHTDSKCSTCQSCCVGLGMVAQGLTWHSPLDNAELPAASLIVSFTGFIPQGLERPPRTILV